MGGWPASPTPDWCVWDQLGMGPAGGTVSSWLALSDWGRGGPSGTELVGGRGHGLIGMVGAHRGQGWLGGGATGN